MADKNKSERRLLHVSLMRMGTMSMFEAYRILGFNPHHVLVDDTINDWKSFGRAVDGKYPDNPKHRKFTREDWDAVHGEYDFFTDLYGHFSVDIIEAYPEAKVVIVQRDFESWWPSYKSQCLDSIQKWWLPALSVVLLIANGVDLAGKYKKLYARFHEVGHVSQIDKANARRSYDEFFEEVRRVVPPERRLDFKVSDGWAPLCKFLDKPVPDIPFPKVNTRAEHEKNGWRMVRRQIAAGLMPIGAVAVAGYGIWYALKLRSG